MSVFKTINEVKQANKEIGQLWFSRGAMSFFNTTIETGLMTGCGGMYFITHETDNELISGFTIREVDEAGNVETCGALCQYKSIEDAMEDLEAYKNEVHE